MSTVEHELFNPSGCPVTHFEEVNTPASAAGWHMLNFDVKREEGAVHTGDANGNQYFLITRMAEIRKSFQTADVFSNSAVTPTDPDPPYRWIPEMLDGGPHLAWRQLLTPRWTP